ncbi:MAG: hypothetical protein COA79_14770, partial [Planctomycetota bacterium]
MVKKLLNPLVVSAFIFVLMLGSLAHLMYGSCQTTKYHYLCQAYWMPEYLPGWMLSNIGTPIDYTGTWSVWGNFGLENTDYIDGVYHGKMTSWYANGAPSKAWCFLLGVSPDLEILPSSEELIRASHS